MKRHYLSRTTFMIALIAAAASAAMAHEPGESAETEAVESARDRDWQLRFGFIVTDSTGETSVAVDPGSVDISLSGGGGGWVSLERRVSPLLGIEFGMTGIGLDMNVSTHAGSKHIGADANALAMGALTLGANFHFVKDGPVDVYAGPLLSFNSYSGFSVRTGTCDGWCSTKHDGWAAVSTKTDSEFTWGAKAGLDIPLGKKKRWSLGCSFTYIDATYQYEQDSQSGRTSISLDPLLFSFGAGFRF